MLAETPANFLFHGHHGFHGIPYGMQGYPPWIPQPYLITKNSSNIQGITWFIDKALLPLYYVSIKRHENKFNKCCNLLATHKSSVGKPWCSICCHQQTNKSFHSDHHHRLHQPLLPTPTTAATSPLLPMPIAVPSHQWPLTTPTTYKGNYSSNVAMPHHQMDGEDDVTDVPCCPDSDNTYHHCPGHWGKYTTTVLSPCPSHTSCRTDNTAMQMAMRTCH